MLRGVMRSEQVWHRAVPSELAVYAKARWTTSWGFTQAIVPSPYLPQLCWYYTITYITSPRCRHERPSRCVRVDPTCLLRVFVLTVGLVLLPSILRYINTGHFVGTGLEHHGAEIADLRALRDSAGAVCITRPATKVSLLTSASLACGHLLSPAAGLPKSLCTMCTAHGDTAQC